MKAPPPGLPPANSRKWHNRRWWDGLGYLRVRTLANPHWERDIAWLINWLRRESGNAEHTDRVLYDEAIAAAKRYPSRAGDAVERDRAWDEVLAPIDEILGRRQARHLDDVRRARPE